MNFGDKQNISLVQVKRYLSYDESSGIFFWKTDKARAKAGDVAGYVSKGYVYIKLNQKSYMAHRLAWFYVHERWPEMQIDHINMDKSDNRIANLREVSMSQNQQNMLLHPCNKSGIRGVRFDKRKQKWCAELRFEKKKVFCRLFDSAEQAALAYADAAARYHSINPYAKSC